MPLLTQVRLKHTEPCWMAILERQGSSRYLAQAFETLFTWLALQQLEAVGPPIAVFAHNPGAPDDSGPLPSWGVQVQVPAPDQLRETPWSKVRVQPVAGAAMAAVLYRGDGAAITEAYQALDTWIQDHGYRRTGPVQEVYLSATGTLITESVTEVRVPVAPTAEGVE
ncbi:MAG: GyrI-like domain-containing protein [Chloroflexi bacterium]|nr:GyrI-like domain-containing protein [Chloroflexota bacterium]